MTKTLTQLDRMAVEAFTNFLSWGEHPVIAAQADGYRQPIRRNVPPAWWAYALGATEWCPPRGEW